MPRSISYRIIALQLSHFRLDGHGSVTFSSIHPMPTQLKVLDNIYLFHWYAVWKVSRDVYLNATQLGCIIVVRRVQVRFEKEFNDPIKTTRKEGGVTGVINVCPSRLPRRAPGKLRRRIQ
jgi:hypothetical protein